MSAYTGYLIRRERLQRNLSQEGLSKGICAVSYLSKIEQGLVEPGQEIIDRLFAALDIDFIRDPELEAEAARQLDRFFFLTEADLPCEEQKAFFAEHGERLARSEFALYAQVFRLISTARIDSWEETRALLAGIEPFMPWLSVRVRQWVLIVKAEYQDNHEEEWAVLGEAEQLGAYSVVTYKRAVCACQQGRYGLSMELADRAYQQAAYEGNVMTMAWSCFLMGTCACNRYDMEQAKRYYDRVMALTRGSTLKMSNYIRYNLGSSYLEMGDEARAFEILRDIGDEKEDMLHNVLLHQKLAILNLRSGKREEGLDHIQKAKAFFAKSAWPRMERRAQLIESMIRFAELMMDEETMRSPEFEEVTRTLYDESEGQFGFGFKHFYGRYLVQLYKRQRRYKDALLVQEEMSN